MTCQLIWTEVWIPLHPKNIRERNRKVGPRVLASRSITLSGRMELEYFRQRFSLSGDRYCDEVIPHNAGLFRGINGTDYVFIYESVRPCIHKSYSVEKFLGYVYKKYIYKIDWPTCFSELNPMENARDVLRRRPAARLYPPKNTR